MAWKKVTKSDMYQFIDGVTLEGTYISKLEGQGQKSNSTVHTVRTEDGDQKFWGSTVLDDKLKEVEDTVGFGRAVRITYLGKATSKTGTSYKAWDVEFDDPNQN